MEEDFINYYDTPFQNSCDKVVNEISQTFKNKGFTEKYLKFYRDGTITKSDVENYIYDSLLGLDEFTKHDFNKMCSMLSDKNCWYVDYNIGQIVHEQLLKIWNI